MTFRRLSSSLLRTTNTQPTTPSTTPSTTQFAPRRYPNRPPSNQVPPNYVPYYVPESLLRRLPHRLGQKGGNEPIQHMQQQEPRQNSDGRISSRWGGGSGGSGGSGSGSGGFRRNSYPYRVTVIGAAGQIGQPLSLLLKAMNIRSLNLFDIAPVTKGVAVDLSHIPTACQITGFQGDSELPASLGGSDVVVIPAGMPRKPGMTRDDLFNVNAQIVANVAKEASKACPNAIFLIITNPVNSTVPVFSEVMAKNNVLNPKKIIGVTTLDVLRARTFLAAGRGIRPETLTVNVIGGHAGATILPLFSQTPIKLTNEETEKLTERVMKGGEEVVNAKVTGSATLSMAQAAAYFTRKVLDGLIGRKSVQCGYVASHICKDKDIPYFASPLLLGREGVEQIYDLGTLSSFEQSKFDAMLPELKDQITKGIEFGKKF